MQPDLCGQERVTPPAEQSEQGPRTLVVTKNLAVACRAKHAPGKTSVWANAAESGGSPMIKRQQIRACTIADELGPALDFQGSKLC
jgi:hypothetical protein